MEHSQLLTILTADLKGFSNRLHLHEQDVIRMLVDSYYRVAENNVSAHGGRLFRKEGDAIWCSFNSVRGAVSAAVGIQEDVFVHNLTATQPRQMQLRMGLHLGEVTLTDDGEVLGHTLSVAKRLETACEVDGIAISEPVYSQVANLHLGYRFEHQGTIELKGVGPTSLFLGEMRSERRQQLELERGEGGSMILVADLGSLDSPTEWERQAIKLRGEDGLYSVGADGLAYLVVPPSRVVGLLPLLDGPRVAVGYGRVVSRATTQGWEIYGQPLEELVEAVRGGLAAGVKQTTVAAANLGVTEARDIDRPTVTTLGDTSLVELEIGTKPDFAYQQLALKIPHGPRTLRHVVVGRVGEDGSTFLHHQDVEKLKAALERSYQPPDLLVGPERLSALGLPHRPVNHLDELQPEESDQLLAWWSQPQRVLIAAGPDPTVLKSLVVALEQECESVLDGHLAQRLEEAEDILGRAGLEALIRQQLTDRPAAVGDAHLILRLFPDGGEGILLGGTIANPRLTEEDQEQAISELRQIPHDQVHCLSTQPVVMTACPLTEPSLRTFYRQLRTVAPAGEEQETFLCMKDPPDELSRWWRRRGVTVIPRPLGNTRPPEPPPEPKLSDPRVLGTRGPETPYKFLDYFSPNDRAIFFGRDQEIERLTALVATRDTVVVFGRSGVGKTSLLQAGVLVRFPAPKHMVVEVRCLWEPLALIETALAPLVGAGTLKQLLARVSSKISGHLIIVLDQFEEFFVRLTPPQRLPFFEAMAELNTAMPERCHVLISLREDFLAEMADFDPYYPKLVDHRFRLQSLTEQQAREAIVGPAELFGISLEEQLVNHLLNELFSDGVEPPELQIVLDRLYQMRDKDRQAITMATYSRLGGVRTILVDYLHATIASVPKRYAEADLARRLLKAMVTGHGTKAVIGRAALAEKLGHRAEDLTPLIDELIAARLVRPLVDDAEAQIELAHEYVIAEVLSWATQEELATRHAHLVLTSEMERWSESAEIMDPQRLVLVERESSRLSLDPDEAAFLASVAAFHGRDLKAWISASPAAATESLVDMLEDPELPGQVIRSILIELFGNRPDDRVCQQLIEATRRAGNPNLLAELPEGPEALRRAFERAVAFRFFGPHRMELIPTGPAIIGSTRSEKVARKALLREDQGPAIDGEADRHTVDLPEFWLDRCPVTNAEFCEFAPEHRHRFQPKDLQHPAVFVSWYQANDYAQWVGKRLASEQEWEKAARGSDGRIYPWGDHLLPERLNMGLGHTTMVGSYPEGASPYDCLDMAGNIWEWTSSEWREGLPFKIQKGGSTLSPEALFHASTRLESFPDFIQQWVGFRAAADEVPEWS